MTEDVSAMLAALRPKGAEPDAPLLRMELDDFYNVRIAQRLRRQVGAAVADQLVCHFKNRLT